MSFIIGANSAVGGVLVDNSCRFDGTSAYMHKTPGSAGNQIQFTISLWCKRGILGTKQTLFSAVNDASNETECHFETDDTLNFRDNEGGSWMFQKRTTQKFRDVSAWYHLVFSSVSGTQKIWVNGVEVTSWTTDTNGSGTATWNDDNVMTVGAKYNGTSAQDYFGGYIAEFVSIDGLTLTPTSFGENNEDSPTIWQPIAVSGLTFGTNGFYLDFEDSSNLGNDANGGTDLTESGLAATDQTTDTPVNNFATLDFVTSITDIPTFSEGNTKIVMQDAAVFGAQSTIGVAAGKWYAEFKLIASSDNDMAVGVNSDGDSPRSDLGAGFGTHSTAYRETGTLAVNGTDDISYGDSYTVDDIVGIALDLDNNKLYFSKNGTFQNSGDPTSGATGTGALALTAAASTQSGFYFFNPSCHSSTQGGTWSANFGNPPYANSSDAADADGYGAFEYAPPSGYYALCTKNLGAYGG